MAMHTSSPPPPSPPWELKLTPTLPSIAAHKPDWDKSSQNFFMRHETQPKLVGVPHAIPSAQPTSAKVATTPSEPPSPRHPGLSQWFTDPGTQRSRTSTAPPICAQPCAMIAAIFRVQLVDES